MSALRHCVVCGKPTYQHWWLRPIEALKLEEHGVRLGQCENAYVLFSLIASGSEDKKELYWVITTDIKKDFDWSCFNLAEDPCDQAFMRSISS